MRKTPSRMPREMRMMMNRRDLELVSRLNISRATEVAEEEGQLQPGASLSLMNKGVETNDTVEIPTQSTQFSWIQALKNPKFLSEFERVAQRVDDALDGIPSFDLGIFPPSQPLPPPRVVKPILSQNRYLIWARSLEKQHQKGQGSSSAP